MKVFEGTDKEFYLDGFLKTNLDTAKNVIKQDWDMIFCIDGIEGSGKSTLALQCAFYLDSTLDLTRIVFTAETFKKAILKAEKYQAVVYDEAYSGLSSRGTMTEVNRTLISMLAEIRQKNLFVFVVMPTFFDLDRYVSLWRSRVLIHVYTAQDFKRGFFAFYNVDKKKELFILGKKFYSYRSPSPNFIGRFTGHLPVPDADYRAKKRNALNAREVLNADKEHLKDVENLLFERVMALGDKFTNADKMKILNIKHATYWRKVKKLEE